MYIHMIPDNDNSPIGQQSQELNKLIDKSDHLSLFGTLTSLVSTGFMFYEQAVGAKLPKWVNHVALGTTGVGIAGVIASFYYRLKAGKIALYSSAHINNDEHIKEETGVELQEPQGIPDRQQKWTSKALHENEVSSAELQR